ncbi:hypothetical protein HK098_003702 [Nowakowskiella sp. JEL0407]|nr:hypothetical protein HK098_003702 [Nowakowskiella sp. JEL0407]
MKSKSQVSLKDQLEDDENEFRGSNKSLSRSQSAKSSKSGSQRIRSAKSVRINESLNTLQNLENETHENDNPHHESIEIQKNMEPDTQPKNEEQEILMQLASMGISTLPPENSRKSVMRRPESSENNRDPVFAANRKPSTNNRRESTATAAYQVLDNLAENSAFGMKLGSNGKVDEKSIDFDVVELGVIIDKIIDKLDLRSGDSSSSETQSSTSEKYTLLLNENKSLGLKLKMQTSMVTELGRKISKLQKMLTESQKQCEDYARQKTEMQESVSLIEKRLVEAEEETKVAKNAIQAAEQAIIDAAADAAQAAASAAYSQLKKQETEAKNSKHAEEDLKKTKSREFSNSSVKIAGSRPTSASKSTKLKFDASEYKEKKNSGHIHLNHTSDSEKDESLHSKRLDPFDQEFIDSIPIGTNITKDMIIDAARMISKKKKYEPPSTLLVGLNIKAKRDEHLEHNPYHSILHSTSSNFPVTSFHKPNIARLTKQTRDRHHHLSTVLSNQAQQLLSSSNPEEYIQILHTQLENSLTAIHDCIDLLAEEQQLCLHWKHKCKRLKQKFAYFIEETYSLRDSEKNIFRERTLGKHRKQFLINELVPVIQSRQMVVDGQNHGFKRISSASSKSHRATNIIENSSIRPMTTGQMEDFNGDIEKKQKDENVRIIMPSITTVFPFNSTIEGQAGLSELKRFNEAQSVERSAAYQQARNFLDFNPQFGFISLRYTGENFYLSPTLPLNFNNFSKRNLDSSIQSTISIVGSPNSFITTASPVFSSPGARLFSPIEPIQESNLVPPLLDIDSPLDASTISYQNVQLFNDMQNIYPYPQQIDLVNPPQTPESSLNPPSRQDSQLLDLEILPLFLTNDTLAHTQPIISQNVYPPENLVASNFYYEVFQNKLDPIRLPGEVPPTPAIPATDPFVFDFSLLLQKYKQNKKTTEFLGSSDKPILDAIPTNTSSNQSDFANYSPPPISAALKYLPEPFQFDSSLFVPEKIRKIQIPSSDYQDTYLETSLPYTLDSDVKRPQRGRPRRESRKVQSSPYESPMNSSEGLECGVCQTLFQRRSDLKRHQLTHQQTGSYSCEFAGCNKKYSRYDNMRAHMRRAHQSENGSKSDDAVQ